MADTDLRQAERNFKTGPNDDNAAQLLKQQCRNALTSTKVYLIVKNNYEYNDEYYYPTEGYTTTEAFTKEPRAQEECRKKNRAEFLRRELTGWIPDGDALFRKRLSKELLADFKKCGLPSPYESDDDEFVDRFTAALNNAHRAGRLPECFGLVCEVKINPIPIGDLLRQMNLYGEHLYVDHEDQLTAPSGFDHRPINKSNRWKWLVATAYPLNDNEIALLNDQGYKHVFLGDKFKSFCESKLKAKNTLQVEL